ncbi:MAG: QueT transporter family protein [Clostridia bacterium]
MQKKLTTKMIAQGAMIAALYAVLVLIFHPISFGKENGIECRISEILTVLPVFTPAAVPGLFVGCLIGNIFGGGSIVDIIFGSLTTLLAAFLTYKLRRNRFLAVLPPIVLNGVIVGGYLPKVYGLPIPVWLSMVLVAAGQLVSCGFGGLLLSCVIDKTTLFKDR